MKVILNYSPLPIGNISNEKRNVSIFTSGWRGRWQSLLGQWRRRRRRRRRSWRRWPRLWTRLSDSSRFGIYSFFSYDIVESKAAVALAPWAALQYIWPTWLGSLGSTAPWLGFLSTETYRAILVLGDWAALPLIGSTYLGSLGSVATNRQHLPWLIGQYCNM